MFIHGDGTHRERKLPGPKFSVGERWVDFSGGLHQVSTSTIVDGTQITESDGNPWPPPKKSKRGKLFEDVGSEFFTQKRELVTPRVFPYTALFATADPLKGYHESSFGGSLVANCLKCYDIPSYRGVPKIPFEINWPPDLSSSHEELVEEGVNLIAAASPGNQVAHVATALGELLQQLPALPGVALWESELSAISLLIASSDEFLNWMFGISPTLNDMKDFIKGVHKVEKAVAQFIDDSGKQVRRRFEYPIPIEESTEVLDGIYSPAGWAGFTGSPAYGYCWPAPEAGNTLPIRQTIRRRVTERKRWFSGAFTYHLPWWFDTNSDLDRVLLTAKLLGAQPDLNTLWELAPWSWAVDWVSNAGQYVSNLQDKIDYGTILRYGYVMETTITTDTYTAGEQAMPAPRGNLVAPFPVISSVTLRTTTKKRIRANPFGFGLSWDGLSTIQQAILAALGISRGGNSKKTKIHLL